MTCPVQDSESALSPAATFLLGTSEAMSAVRAMIRKIAPSDAPVLITGPSGSGKERAALAIHAESKRANKPFVAINCGAIPRDLLESELFGHEKGSFTGAVTRRMGRFEEAHGGTLFLDEIGDMPADMQVKLLRVIEERRVTRIGGEGSHAVDIRIVSATHRDLSSARASNAFRDDLYFRLAVLPIAMPALCLRAHDIPLLARAFLKTMAPNFTITLAPSAYAQLAAHHWPGNVRELRNVVMRAAVLHAGETVNGAMIAAMIDAEIEAGAATPTALATSAQPSLDDGAIDLRALLAGIEGRYIDDALQRADGVIADAARLLGLRRTTLIEKMRRHL
jgi:sigma-54 dependent transcriptional regulator, flagellar regulatory protein